MDASEFRKTYSALYDERQRLVSQRDEMELELNELRAKIKHLDKALENLVPLADMGGLVPEMNQLGLTDAVRQVLELSGVVEERLSATEVRTKLTEYGYDLSALSAPMASIYKVLARLSEKHQEITREKEGGRVYYTWTSVPF